MNKFRHPNILPCLDSFANQDFKIIVTPYCEEGTLYTQLEAAGGYFSEDLAVDILKQLAHAIAVIINLCRKCTLKASSIEISS